MRRLTRLLLPLLVNLHPVFAHADEVVIGLEQVLSHQQNAFGLNENERSEGTYGLRPSIRFQRPEGKLTYDVSYIPTYDVYFKSNELNGVGHFSNVTLEYAVLPVAKLNFHTNFAVFQLNRAFEVVGDSGIPELIPEAAGKINRLFSDLEYEHQLSRATRAKGSVRFQRYDLAIPNAVDNQGLSAEVELIREPISSVGIGGSLVGSWRRFDDQLDSQNTVVNPNLVLNLRPTETVSLSLRAGPAFLEIRYKLNGGADTTDRRVTWAMDSELLKMDRWGYFRLSFQRAEIASAGGASTTLRDSASAMLLLRSGKQWSGSVFANWNQRKSSASSTDATSEREKSNIRQYTTSLQLTRRVIDRLDFSAQFIYLQQSQKDSISRTRQSFDNLIGQLTIRYTFEPIPYPSPLSIGLR